MFVIAKKKSRNHRQDLVVKNLWKICRQAYGFCLAFLTIPEECMVAMSILTKGKRGLSFVYYCLIVYSISTIFCLYYFSLCSCFLVYFHFPPLVRYYSRGGVLIPNWFILNKASLMYTSICHHIPTVCEWPPHTNILLKIQLPTSICALFTILC